jgi:hypothetical protein
MDRSWISPLHSRRNPHHDNTDIEANKELVRTYTQAVFNEHHTEHASDFLARKVKWHGGTLGTREN